MKSAFKIAYSDPQKNIAKKYKTMKLCGFLSNFRGLNYPSYQLVEAIFL